MTSATATPFSELGLSEPVLSALRQIGYEQPTPIQEQSIPPLLEGRDLLGTAQTGTGKTAAFAMPLLSRLDPKRSKPQVLVLAPTRELAIQVAEAFQTYAAGIPGFHVLPIYGGQSMGIQLKQLSRGAHVVVGTPGRVMDHLRRGTLKLDQLKSVVLDEADEMLRMGFIEDVQWILEHTPPQRQVALFSATMPPAIRKVADTYLREPVRIRIESKTSTVEQVEQKFWVVAGASKLDALTRILEVEEFDGIIIFVRTKIASVNLADRLEARGHSAAAINGDMTQQAREATITRLRNGSLDILVATDVAARGIDVPRVSHVINYDIPNDPEAYVHRIGRTGRAGRAGTAILFVAPRERRLLAAIERATRQKMTPMELPSKAAVGRKRDEQFKARLTDALAGGGLRPFEVLIEEYITEHEVDAHQVAAALASLLQGEGPTANRSAPEPAVESPAGPERARRGAPADRPKKAPAPPAAGKGGDRPARSAGPAGDDDQPELELFRLAVGHEHNVKPGDIVGAIANEADLEAKYIGGIRLFDDHSTVELPVGMPKELEQLLRRVRVRNVPLGLTRMEDAPEASSRPAGKPKPRKKPGSGKPGSDD